MQEILNCPFCGNLPEVSPQRTNSSALGDYYAVWCTGPCQALGPERRGEAEAIAAWNQRATPEPAGDLVERSQQDPGAFLAEKNEILRTQLAASQSDVARLVREIDDALSYVATRPRGLRLSLLVQSIRDIQRTARAALKDTQP